MRPMASSRAAKMRLEALFNGRGDQMKHRLALLAGVVVVALTLASSAFAFDCMRVSSSPQGLQQSASNSGNCLYFDMTDGGSGVAHVVVFFGLPSSSLGCFQAAYNAAGGPNLS